MPAIAWIPGADRALMERPNGLSPETEAYRNRDVEDRPELPVRLETPTVG